MTAHVPVVVIGAGISGLVCAHALSKRGMQVLVLEAASRPGGVIRSERRDGFLLELGPQSFNATPAVLELCRELQIDDQLVQAPHGAPRYVLVDGALRQVPLSPPSFFTSSLFSVATKWRVLSDIIGHSTPPKDDESLAGFVRRKFSVELLEKLVGPFVSGIYAGDPEKLSLQSAFPQLHEAESQAGSVIRGLLRGEEKKDGLLTKKRSEKGEKEKPGLRSFRDGNQTLVDTLGKSLGSSIWYGVQVQEVCLAEQSNSRQFEIRLHSSGGIAQNAGDAGLERIVVDQVILATNASHAARLLAGVDTRFETALNGIEYAPVNVVSLGYDQSSIRHSLNGFGFLVPRSSGIRMLGSVWNSSLFPGRAPGGHVLLANFVGGITDPQAISLAPTDLVAVVHRELSQILGIRQPPVFSHVEKYSQAIPQLNIGHGARLSELENLRTKYPNLRLCGNYMRGPAIGACVEQALTRAAEIAKT